MPRNPIWNALAAATYIVGIVVLIWMAPTFIQEEKDTILIPMAMLSLLVLSVSVMAYLFFYHPIMMYIEGDKKGSVNYFTQMIAIFAVITLVFFIVAAVVGSTN